MFKKQKAIKKNRLVPNLPNKCLNLKEFYGEQFREKKI